MMKVYFIPGLGADHRIFKHIKLPEGYEKCCLDWIKPLSKETISSYAQRLSESISEHEPFIIVGLSMGGMIAQEIARYKTPQKIILISSANGNTDLPIYYQAARVLAMYKWISPTLLKKSSLVKRLFTSESKSEKQLLRQLIKETDNAFLRWSLEAILKWRMPGNNQILHIHGSRDLIIPARYLKQPCKIVKNAGHLLVITHAAEVNSFLKEAVEAPCPDHSIS